MVKIILEIEGPLKSWFQEITLHGRGYLVGDYFEWETKLDGRQSFLDDNSGWKAILHGEEPLDERQS